jgi:catalase-peroxidase
MSSEAKCPFNHAAGGGTTNTDWWPEQLRLELLSQHSDKSDPLGANFDYAAEFRKLDYFALKKDLLALMTDSQDWWPSELFVFGQVLFRFDCNFSFSF